jgi:ribosomal protein L32
MGQPKKQSSPRKTGTRRSHLVLKLARRVNGTSPVKVHTTNRETGKKKLVEVAPKAVKKTEKAEKTEKPAAKAKKPAAKK